MKSALRFPNPAITSTTVPGSTVISTLAPDSSVVSILAPNSATSSTLSLTDSSLLSDFLSPSASGQQGLNSSQPRSADPLS